VSAFDSKCLLENFRLMSTLGVFRIQSIVAEFLHLYDGLLKVWERLHRGLLEASTHHAEIQDTGLSGVPFSCVPYRTYGLLACPKRRLEVSHGEERAWRGKNRKYKLEMRNREREQVRHPATK